MAVSGWFNSCASEPGELAEHGHAREMREFSAPFVQLLFRLLARRDVKGDAAHANRFAIAVVLDAATGGDPTHPAIRENDPILLFVTPAGLLRLPQGLADRVAISWVQPLEKAVYVQPLCLLEAEQLSPLVASPDLVPHEIPNPDAKIGRIGGEAQPLFALAQRFLGPPTTVELNEQRTN
jgi:hypothetical protein